MNKIAVVAISGSTREFDKKYHYSIPGSLSEKVLPGIRVLVPFGGGNSLKEGYVFALTDTSDYSNLKDIKKIIDETPVLSAKMVRLAEWMRERYICTYSDAIKCMLPAGIGVKSFRVVNLLEDRAEQNRDRQKLIRILKDNGSLLDYEELKRISGVKSFSRHIRNLEDSGIIGISEEFTTAVKEKYVRVAFLALPAEEVQFDIESNRIKRIQHIRVLEMLMENEHISVPDLARFAGVSGSVLDTLRKQGYIGYREVEVMRDPVKHRIFERTDPFKPTAQQASALQAITGKLEEGKFAEILVRGVTGSGKTEVYLQLIQRAIEMGRQAIVLVPEISLTPQMVERFKGRFGSEVAVLHSRLSLGEKYDQWRLIKDDRIKVAVGARSAVFAPFEHLGVIIIDEEHETSYKSETTPKYRASEIAVKRCRDNGALAIYGSATPSVETFFRAEKGEITLVEMLDRANNMVMPQVQVVDMRKELEAGNRTAFSAKLSEELIVNKEKGQQTILFLNKRGYASFVLCRSCGFTARCRHCNISLTYHSHDDRLICHYCGFTTKMPKVCPKCSSGYFRQFGTGTQKVEEDIKKLFPDNTVIRMDMDTTSGKNSHEEILRAFREQNINILIGTQMIAKGHDFPNVTLVGVLAADSLLNLDDYKASERTFQLVTQVAGRAGRGELEGRVVIQTYNTEDFSILAACKHDYPAFYKQEIKFREKLGYPPFTNIAVVIVSSVNDRLCFDKSKEVGKKFIEALDNCREGEILLGPVRAPLSKIKNRYRWRLVIKCDSLEKLIKVMGEIQDGFRRSKGKLEIDLSMDINPVSML
ncbi:MAG: primosomal protein N' [Clostridiales bacterium GWC2_40_7]|nr:MAG: primosomal protein N' [Clostridiales bacterium GWC2_40_7]